MSVGLASLGSDAGHEMTTSLLPTFLTSTLHAGPAALGAIEGLSDALTGLSKLAGGPVGRRPGPPRTSRVRRVSGDRFRHGRDRVGDGGVAGRASASLGLDRARSAVPCTRHPPGLPGAAIGLRPCIGGRARRRQCRCLDRASHRIRPHRCHRHPPRDAAGLHPRPPGRSRHHLRGPRGPPYGGHPGRSTYALRSTSPSCGRPAWPGHWRRRRCSSSATWPRPC